MPLHNSVADVMESNSGLSGKPVCDYRKQICGEAVGAGFQQLAAVVGLLLCLG